MASPATSPDEGAFRTPKNVRVRKLFSNGGSPVTIPASPFMKKLGCGTGVNVYLMDRLVLPCSSNTICLHIFFNVKEFFNAVSGNLTKQITV